MKIIVDAMGGDNAPDQIVLGAVQAAKAYDTEILLVGRGEAILESLKNNGMDTLPKGVEIANADDVVDMHDDPATVVKRRKDSSMVVGLRLLAEGSGDAMVSAGSTGALLSAATLVVKRVRGIRRAAMSPVVPTANGGCLLIDCGANAECTPEFLLQFGYMGSFYAEKALGRQKPKVALLNIGEEDTKGQSLHKEAYQLLKKAGDAGDINFIGNIEARDVPLGGADVVVADGFSGNVLLKGIEGTAMFLAGVMKQMFLKNTKSKVAALLVKDGIQDFKKLLDYRETGGTVMLGLCKPVVKAHGSSDALAIQNAVRQAVEAVNADVCGEITRNIDKMKLTKEQATSC
jgi:glycerol-3-phosphate acyltransferase PlsX